METPFVLRLWLWTHRPLSSSTIQKVLIAAMSLKSKLEAVIYAAEEPVTLGQLAT